MTARRNKRLQLLNDQKNAAHLRSQARQKHTPPSLRGEKPRARDFFPGRRARFRPGPRLRRTDNRPNRTGISNHDALFFSITTSVMPPNTAIEATR